MIQSSSKSKDTLALIPLMQIIDYIYFKCGSYCHIPHMLFSIWLSLQETHTQTWAEIRAPDSSEIKRNALELKSQLMKLKGYICPKTQSINNLKLRT